MESGHAAAAAIITALVTGIAALAGALVSAYISLRKNKVEGDMQKESLVVKGLQELLEEQKKNLLQLDAECDRRTTTLRRERDKIFNQLTMRLQDLASATERIAFYEMILEQNSIKYSPWKSPSSTGSASSFDTINEESAG
jgi:hypothetical protein